MPMRISPRRAPAFAVRSEIMGGKSDQPPSMAATFLLAPAEVWVTGRVALVLAAAAGGPAAVGLAFGLVALGPVAFEPAGLDPVGACPAGKIRMCPGLVGSPRRLSV